MTPSSQAEVVTALLREALADLGTASRLASFGAIAEFMRALDKAASGRPDARLGTAT